MVKFLYSGFKFKFSHREYKRRDALWDVYPFARQPKSSFGQNWDYAVLCNVIPAKAGGADSVQLFPGGVHGISFREPKDGFK